MTIVWKTVLHWKLYANIVKLSNSQKDTFVVNYLPLLFQKLPSDYWPLAYGRVDGHSSSGNNIHVFIDTVYEFRFQLRVEVDAAVPRNSTWQKRTRRVQVLQGSFAIWRFLGSLMLIRFHPHLCGVLGMGHLRLSVTLTDLISVDSIKNRWIVRTHSQTLFTTHSPVQQYSPVKVKEYSNF